MFVREITGFTSFNKEHPLRLTMNMKLWEDDDYYLGLHFQVLKPLVLGREHIACCTLGMQKIDSDILTSQRLSFPNLNPASFGQMIQFDQIWPEFFFGVGLIQFDLIWSNMIPVFLREVDEHIIPTYPSLALGLRILLGFSAPKDIQFFCWNSEFWATKCRLKPPISSFSSYLWFKDTTYKTCLEDESIHKN